MLGFHALGEAPLSALVIAAAIDVYAEFPASYAIAGDTTPRIDDVRVTPTGVTMEGGATQQFVHEVLGPNDPSQDVTWTVNPGIVDAFGTVTAPLVSSEQVGTVIATSTVDPRRSGSAIFLIRPAGAPDNGTGDPVSTFTPSASRTVRILPGRQVYDVGPFWTVNGTLGPVGSKDPNSTIDIPWDWSAWLADIGDPALSAIDFLLSPGLMSAGVVPLLNDGKVVGATVMVSGGTLSQIHTITCRITTVTEPSRTDDRTVVLQIKDQ